MKTSEGGGKALKSSNFNFYMEYKWGELAEVLMLF